MLPFLPVQVHILIPANNREIYKACKIQQYVINQDGKSCDI